MTREIVNVRGSEIGVEFYTQGSNKRLFELTAAVAAGGGGGGGGGAADFGAIAEDMLPANDATNNVGSAAKRFKDLWLSGDVHMASGTNIYARNVDDDANIPILRALAEQFDANPPGTLVDAIAMIPGGANPATESKGFFIDNDYSGGAWLLGLGLTFAAGGAKYKGTYSGVYADDPFMHDRVEIYDIGLDTFGRDAAADALINDSTYVKWTATYWDGAASAKHSYNSYVVMDDNDPAPLSRFVIEAPGDLHAFEIDQAGVPSFPALPTSDPEVAGKLYEDPVTHAVKVSQGA